MNKEYYFISDLHIGGNLVYDKCKFKDELIFFLKKLSYRNKDTELIIVGDMFGFYELTTVTGKDKLIYTINTNKKLFDQFKKTGKNIKITLIPGNHDHELVCYPSNKDILKKYNINLEEKEHIIRKIGSKDIWIEHGHQRSIFDKIEKFKDPYSKSFGYYLTTFFSSQLTKMLSFGKRRWIRDLRFVRPKKDIFKWFVSNYFYRELNPVLRCILVILISFFGISLLALLCFILGYFNIIYFPFLPLLSNNLGYLGYGISLILLIDIIIMLILLIFSFPFYTFLFDFRSKLRYYGVLLKKSKKSEISNNIYIEVAKKIFRENPNVSIFIFGHTHDAFIKKLSDKIIINTGTWLLSLIKVKTRFFMPSVFYPVYNLDYFKVYLEDSKIKVVSRKINKKAKFNLTTLQKIFTFRKKVELNNRPIKEYFIKDK